MRRDVKGGVGTPTCRRARQTGLIPSLRRIRKIKQCLKWKQPVLFDCGMGGGKLVRDGMCPRGGGAPLGLAGVVVTQDGDALDFAALLEELRQLVGLRAVCHLRGGRGGAMDRRREGTRHESRRRRRWSGRFPGGVEERQELHQKSWRILVTAVPTSPLTTAFVFLSVVTRSAASPRAIWRRGRTFPT